MTFNTVFFISGFTGLVVVVVAISVYGLYLLVHRDIEKGAMRLLELVQCENAHALWLISTYLERKTELLLSEWSQGAPYSREKRRMLEARVTELHAQIEEHISHVKRHLDQNHVLTKAEKQILEHAKDSLEGAQKAAPPSPSRPSSLEI